MFGSKALMKGTKFADTESNFLFFFSVLQMCFNKLPTGIRVRVLSPSQTMSFKKHHCISVNGTQQNKEFKMHHCWC